MNDNDLDIFIEALTAMRNALDGVLMFSAAMEERDIKQDEETSTDTDIEVS